MREERVHYTLVSGATLHRSHEPKSKPESGDTSNMKQLVSASRSDARKSPADANGNDNLVT
jgi:hypothetical protein